MSIPLMKALPLTALLACFALAPRPALADDAHRTRIDALEKKIKELEELVRQSRPTPAPMPTPPAPEVEKRLNTLEEKVRRQEGHALAFDKIHFHGYGEAMDHTVALLRRALALSEQALRTWSARVVDPTDLGTLAGLNAYGHDYLRGLAWQIYLDSQFYGFSLG